MKTSKEKQESTLLPLQALSGFGGDLKERIKDSKEYRRVETGSSQERQHPVNGKLKHRKFHLNTRKNFFTLRMTEHWNRLPRGTVKSPSPEIFKLYLDKVLCSLLWVTLLPQKGWTR